MVTMTLPADYSRCAGRDEAQCDTCLRRDVEGMDRVWWMPTPKDHEMLANGGCVKLISENDL